MILNYTIIPNKTDREPYHLLKEIMRENCYHFYKHFSQCAKVNTLFLHHIEGARKLTRAKISTNKVVSQPSTVLSIWTGNLYSCVHKIIQRYLGHPGNILKLLVYIAVSFITGRTNQNFFIQMPSKSSVCSKSSVSKCVYVPDYEWVHQ